MILTNALNLPTRNYNIKSGYWPSTSDDFVKSQQEQRESVKEKEKK